MEESLFVYVQYGFCQLFSYVTNLVLFKLFSSFFAVRHQFVKILLDILKNKVGLIDDSNDFLEFNDVRVVHFFFFFDFGEL